MVQPTKHYESKLSKNTPEGRAHNALFWEKKNKDEHVVEETIKETGKGSASGNPKVGGKGDQTWRRGIWGGLQKGQGGWASSGERQGGSQ